MSKANWFGVIITVVIFFVLVGFISSKIIIPNMTMPEISSSSLFDILIAQPVGEFLDSINPFQIKLW